jgi:hypothetical protein
MDTNIQRTEHHRYTCRTLLALISTLRKWNLSGLTISTDRGRRNRSAKLCADLRADGHPVSFTIMIYLRRHLNALVCRYWRHVFEATRKGPNMHCEQSSISTTSSK